MRSCPFVIFFCSTLLCSRLLLQPTLREFNESTWLYIIIVLPNSDIVSYLIYLRIPLTVVKVAIERQEFIVQQSYLKASS